MARLRLLSIGSVPPEWGGKTAGGVATFHHGLLDELRRHPERHGVDVVGVLPLNHDGRSRTLPESLSALTPPADGVEDWYRWLVRERAPDAVMLFHIAHRWALIHLRAAAEVPALGCVRSWHPITFPDGGRAAGDREALAEVIDRMAALVFPSRHALEEGRSLGFDYSCPAWTVPNHVHPTFAATPGVAARSGIVFVGSLIARKNAGLVIEAGARLGHPVTIIGDGEDAARLRTLTAGIGADVRFLGRQPLERVARELAAAEVLCVPSASESFGNVYAEALASGTPVVGFAPTLEEIAERMGVDVGEGVIEPDADSVADHLARVLSKRWDRRGMRAAALATFDVADVARRYVEIAASIAGVRTRSSGKAGRRGERAGSTLRRGAV